MEGADAPWDQARIGGRPSAPGNGTTMMDLARKLVGGVAAGVGVLGVVTLVGGAVEHAQLCAAGLPADEAVAALPRGTMLVIGARLLAVFVVILGIAFSIPMLWARKITTSIRKVEVVVLVVADLGSS